MGELLPMPKVGDLFADVRGDDRTMRISRHEEQGLVVVSLWAGKVCRASFRLSLDEVPRLIEALGVRAPHLPATPDPSWAQSTSEQPLSVEPLSVEAEPELPDEGTATQSA
jgi:hypothetical protein